MLVTFAREKGRLWERVDAASLEQRRSRNLVQVRTVLFAFVLLILLVGVVSLVADAEMPVVVGFVVSVAVVSAILFCAFYTSRYKKEDLPRTISVQDNMVTVETLQTREAFSLTECCWFPGNLSDDDTLAGSLAKGPAVILVAPSGAQFACGLDEQQRQVWRMFFEVAGLRRVMRTGFVEGCLLPLVRIAAAIGAGIGGWYLAAKAIPVLQPVIGAAVAEKLPALAATLTAWAALLGLYLVVPGWYRGTAIEKIVVYRFSVLLPVVVLGAGRRGLGVVRWELVERIPLMLVLSSMLYVFSWLVLRTVDRHRRVAVWHDN
ncbi:MAG: hypothetical protein ACYC6N_24060 [Pirellulaceae bacterium]